MTAEEEQEIYNTMVMTRIGFFHATQILELYHRLGSSTAIMEHRNNIRDVIPDATPHLVEALSSLDEPMRRSAEEMQYCQKKHIRALTISSADYPQRLSQCPDAPLLLYYIGNADLNSRRTINIIGTRHCTAYGQDLILRFVSDLKTLCPDILIFSGLAYGIDICAHRAALDNGINTVGVVAHGLDTVYPSAHRGTASKMVSKGGILTEYMTHTQPIARNFVQRNRIVAGCSDATILVESAAKGGGLITCSIARSYDRDVFAFPGAIGAPYSEGCNDIIRDNGAGLITCAEDFVNAMGWQDDGQLISARKQGIERQIFPSLTDPEQIIADALTAANDQTINMLSVKTGMNISTLTAHLFEMEMKGVIRALAGGTYHLIG